MSEERNYYPVEEPEEEEAALSGADAFKVDLYFWLQALVMALVGLILIFTFVGRIIGVDGESMMPTSTTGTCSCSSPSATRRSREMWWC